MLNKGIVSKYKTTIAASSLAPAWGEAVFILNINFLTSEIFKVTSSGIPSRPPRKLYIEFQLEFCEIQLEEMEKELDEQNEMIEI